MHVGPRSQDVYKKVRNENEARLNSEDFLNNFNSNSESIIGFFELFFTLKVSSQEPLKIFLLLQK